jgi:hypothetical protein
MSEVKESDKANLPPKSHGCRCRVAIWTAVALATLAALLVSARLRDKPAPQSSPAAVARPAPAAPQSDPDAPLRRLVVGVWTDDYQGKRTMTLRADGTGTMLVELSGWRAMLSAPRSEFHMVWSIEGRRLKKRTVGGEPRTQVQLILKTMGDHVDEPILELNAARLLLLDGDGHTRYDWRRVKK